MVESSNILEVPFKYKKMFDFEKQNTLIKNFKNYDKDSNGTINAKEFAAICKDLDVDLNEEE
jgi:Ca2+-binding EF-hand superfamily protein